MISSRASAKGASKAFSRVPTHVLSFGLGVPENYFRRNGKSERGSSELGARGRRYLPPHLDSTPLAKFKGALMDEIHFAAPKKKSWICFDSPVNANEQWFPLFSLHHRNKVSPVVALTNVMLSTTVSFRAAVSGFRRHQSCHFRPDTTLGLAGGGAGRAQ